MKLPKDEVSFERLQRDLEKAEIHQVDKQVLGLQVDMVGQRDRGERKWNMAEWWGMWHLVLPQAVDNKEIDYVFHLELDMVDIGLQEPDKDLCLAM